MPSDILKSQTDGFEPFPRAALGASIPARFRAIVRRFPNRIAVHGKKEMLTYAELDRQSDRIAEILVEQGAAGGTPVLLAMEQGKLAIAAILGILKSASFYVALDAKANAGELGRLVEDLGAKLMLIDEANRDLAGALPIENVELIDPPRLARRFSHGSFERLVSPDALAYAFYTSGTTGKAKAVIDCHRNVLHNILRYTNNLGITANDRLTLLQSLHFSGSVSSLFCALLNGATVYPFDLHHEGAAALADWLAEQEITIYHSVPSIFRLIAHEGKRFTRLRLVRLEGDQASLRDAELFQQNFPASCTLVNGLGATECGIVRQFFFRPSDSLPSRSLPIGYPVPDVEVYLVDDQGRPASAGEIGEIAVKSRYLALGYWNQPELSAAAFVASPDDTETRVYHTGDLGVMSEDGCLDYLGRKDSQPKVRGHRLNLTQVETVLLNIPGVREAVAVIKTDSADEHRLVTYYTSETRAPLEFTAVQQQLQAHLPEHYWPIAIVHLDPLPLTVNGKLDRQALPEPTKERQLSSPLIEPRNEIEAVLRAVWREILEMNEIGIDDSFLLLGGDSLKMMRVLNRVRQEFDREISISEFFLQPTIAQLSDKLARP